MFRPLNLVVDGRALMGHPAVNGMPDCTYDMYYLIMKSVSGGEKG